MRRQSHRLGEIFEKDLSDKGLLLKIYKESLKLKTTKQTILKRGQKPYQTTHQGRYTDDKEVYKKMFKSFIIRKLQINNK